MRRVRELLLCIDRQDILVVRLTLLSDREVDSVSHSSFAHCSHLLGLADRHRDDKGWLRCHSFNFFFWNFISSFDEIILNNFSSEID